MESLAAFLAAATLFTRFRGMVRASDILFALTLIFVAVILSLHADSALKLDF